MTGFTGQQPLYKPEHTEPHQIGADENLLLPPGVASLFAGQPVAVLLAHSNAPRSVEMAAARISQSIEFTSHGGVEIGNLEACAELTTEPLVLTKGKQDAVPLVTNAKSSGGKNYVTGKFVKKSQQSFYMENQSVICIPDEGGITCYVSCQDTNSCQKAISECTGLPQSKVAIKLRRVGGGFGGKIVRPIVYSALTAQMALNKGLPVRLVLPKDIDMQLVGGRQEIEATWETAVDPKTGKITALNYNIFLGHGATEDTQKINGHIMGATLDMNYCIPSMKVTIHYARQHVCQRSAVRSPGHYEACAMIEAVMDGVSAELGIPGHKVREANFYQKLEKVNLKGGLIPAGHLDDYSNNLLWEMVKQKTNFNTRCTEVEEFNKNNTFKKKGLEMSSARYGVFVGPGSTVRVDIFKDGSVQVACGCTEIGQGLHTKVGQVITTHFHKHLGCAPPMDQIRFLDTGTEQIPNATGTGGSTSSEQSMYAAVVSVDQLADRLKKFRKAAKKKKNEKSDKDEPKHPTHQDWFDLTSCAFGQKFMGVLPVPPNLSAVGMHMTKVPNDFMYETFGVAASEVELDVLTGECRVIKTHIMFDIGKSFNPMVDMGQLEGAFVMGLGHVLQEGMDYDLDSGKCLTDNTWTYKPPIACDIPETFNADFVDLTGKRKTAKARGCAMGCLGGIMSCLGMPWKPSKLDKQYKSAKCIGEPPLLLAQSIHSAHMSALIAARGEALPNHTLPIPAKPFVTLPLLSGVKPGSKGGKWETDSTATTVSTAA